MTVPLIVLTNGRDCIHKTIGLFCLLDGFGDLVIVDDSGDARHRADLEAFYGQVATIVHVSDEPAGYWRAMRAVWDVARTSGADKVVFWEDDFVLNEGVDLADLSKVLDEHPHLTQMGLLRQPWWPNEHAHGGLIGALEAQGQVFTDHTDGEHRWVEHRACFTGNPSLIPRRTFEREWPEGAWSESRFGRLLFADPDARGAYWGRREDEPRVTHIGHERVGTDY